MSGEPLALPTLTPAGRSLFWEEVDLGAIYITRVHRVTAADISAFGELTRDRHPLHADDGFARSMGFKGRIAHGLFGLSLMEGLKAELGLYTETSIASLGWDDVRFLAPVYVDDAVRARIGFIEKRPSRRPRRGIVVEKVDLINQDDVPVITARHASLLIMRDSALA